MFNVGDQVKLYNLTSGHTPYTTQVFKIVEPGSVCLCSTEEQIASFEKDYLYRFSETDLYLVYIYDIEEIIKNLEILEKKYEN